MCVLLFGLGANTKVIERSFLIVNRVHTFGFISALRWVLVLCGIFVGWFQTQWHKIFPQTCTAHTHTHLNTRIAHILAHCMLHLLDIFGPQFNCLYKIIQFIFPAKIYTSLRSIKCSIKTFEMATGITSQHFVRNIFTERKKRRCR